MTIQTTGRGAEENTTETSHYRGGGRVRSRENLEQKNSMGKREVLSTVERVYGRRRYVREQGEFGKCERAGRRV